MENKRLTTAKEILSGEGKDSKIRNAYKQLQNVLRDLGIAGTTRNMALGVCAQAIMRQLEEGYGDSDTLNYQTKQRVTNNMLKKVAFLKDGGKLDDYRIKRRHKKNQSEQEQVPMSEEEAALVLFKHIEAQVEDYSKRATFTNEPMTGELEERVQIGKNLIGLYPNVHEYFHDK